MFSISGVVRCGILAGPRRGFVLSSVEIPEKSYGVLLDFFRSVKTSARVIVEIENSISSPPGQGWCVEEASVCIILT